MADQSFSKEHQAIFLLGPWLTGAAVELFLTGVVVCQIANYFSWYNKKDNLVLKLYVGGLGVFSILKSMQAFGTMWIHHIIHIDDLEGAVLSGYTSPWLAGNPLMVASFNIYVQSFFCYRLYCISKKWLVVAPLVVLFIFTYCAQILATYYIYRGASASSSIALWFAIHLSSGFAADMLLTTTTAFFLLRTKREVLPQTVGLISALIRLTFMTAALAAICACFNLVFSQLYVGTQNLTSAAFNMALPKLYAISMMWTLNARQKILAEHSPRRGITSSLNDVSGGRTGPLGIRHKGERDVELGNFSGIQVHTTNETVQHINVRDMFHHSVQDSKIESHVGDSDNGEVEYKN